MAEYTLDLKGQETFEEVLAQITKTYPDYDTTTEESVNYLRGRYEKWRNQGLTYDFWIGYVKPPQETTVRD